MDTNEASMIFTALSQETRLEVFKILVENSLEGVCPCEIAEKLNIPRNTLSFHLALLHKAGLVNKTKHGKMYFYRPNCKKIKEAMLFLHNDCVACHEKEKHLEEAAKC